MRNRAPSPRRPSDYPSTYSPAVPPPFTAPSYHQPYAPAVPHYGYAPGPAAHAMPPYSGHHYNPRPPMGGAGYMPYTPAGHPTDSFGSFANLHRQDWSKVNLVPFEKNFYREHESVKARSDFEVRDYRERHAMSIFGSDIPKPVHSFEEGCFPDYISRMLLSQGFSTPTAIQAQVNYQKSIFTIYLSVF